MGSRNRPLPPPPIRGLLVPQPDLGTAGIHPLIASDRAAKGRSHIQAGSLMWLLVGGLGSLPRGALQLEVPDTLSLNLVIFPPCHPAPILSGDLKTVLSCLLYSRLDESDVPLCPLTSLPPFHHPRGPSSSRYNWSSVPATMTNALETWTPLSAPLDLCWLMLCCQMEMGTLFLAPIVVLGRGHWSQADLGVNPNCVNLGKRVI
ncbi:hypothetical protein Cadr_000013446 [Camelus dromedarius]|uniref:Uncharacterized protein n=1 Tax=Camelus dromedarius TaxID=9838 RepID=A0A5N4DD45_CAMDR|nr:hypothetical protein Cadr_000013446 [Camelus dromedarius]